jgi:hypothetical protein
MKATVCSPSRTRLRLLVLAFTGIFMASISWAQDETKVKVITNDKNDTKVRVKVIANIPATLQPDVLHGFVLGNSSIDRGYVIEITPVTLLSSADDGASIESFVEPEFNGPTRTWIDVVRVLLRNASASVGANIRVYALVPLLKEDKSY